MKTASHMKRMVIISEKEYMQLKQNSQNDTFMSRMDETSHPQNNFTYSNTDIGARHLQTIEAKKNEDKKKKMEDEEEEEEMNRSGTADSSLLSSRFSRASQSSRSSAETLQDRSEERYNKLIEYIKEYISGNARPRAELLAKRILNEEDSVIKQSEVVLGKHTFSKNNFVDLIEISTSQKKPAEIANINQFIEYLYTRSIPDSLLYNKHIKDMYQSRKDMKTEPPTTDSESDDDNPNQAWYESFEQVPRE